jgi:LPXTG-motif cell wall-anchored protein
VEGIAPPPVPPAGAPSAPAPPSAPASGSGEQGAGPVNRVGPLVGANNGPAPAELPPTGTTDLAWLLWLALAGLAVGSGVLLRRAARQRTS